MVNKNPHENYPVDWVHKVIYKMIVTKDLNEKLFDQVYL